MRTQIRYIMCPGCNEAVMTEDGMIEDHKSCSYSKTYDINHPAASVWAIPTAVEQGKNRKH